MPRRLQGRQGAQCDSLVAAGASGHGTQAAAGVVSEALSPAGAAAALWLLGRRRVLGQLFALRCGRAGALRRQARLVLAEAGRRPADGLHCGGGGECVGLGGG